MERSTRQRAAIQTAIAAAQRPLSPQEVFDAARVEVPALGMATVYRSLRTLVEEGKIEAVNLPGDSPRYEVTGQGHHHHFQCNVCQRVFDIHACPGSFGHLAPQGFSVESHDITLYGRCADCQPKPGTRRAVARKSAGKA